MFNTLRNAFVCRSYGLFIAALVTALCKSPKALPPIPQKCFVKTEVRLQGAKPRLPFQPRAGPADSPWAWNILQVLGDFAPSAVQSQTCFLIKHADTAVKQHAFHITHTLVLIRNMDCFVIYWTAGQIYLSEKQRHHIYSLVLWLDCGYKTSSQILDLRRVCDWYRESPLYKIHFYSFSAWGERWGQ